MYITFTAGMSEIEEDVDVGFFGVIWSKHRDKNLKKGFCYWLVKGRKGKEVNMTDSPTSPTAGRTKSLMDNLLGLLRIRVKRGVNLAVRDVRSSDPYVVVKMGKQVQISIMILRIFFWSEKQKSLLVFTRFLSVFLFNNLAVFVRSIAFVRWNDDLWLVSVVARLASAIKKTSYFFFFFFLFDGFSSEGQNFLFRLKEIIAFL